MMPVAEQGVFWLWHIARMHNEERGYALRREEKGCAEAIGCAQGNRRH